MKLPGRKELEANDPYAGIARGQRIDADNSRVGVVDDGCVAWEERIIEARRSWPQARPEDFERFGRRGYRDRATGVEYVAARGAVMLDPAGEQYRGIIAFFVSGGKLVFLRRPEFEDPLLGPVGHVTGQQLTPQTPGPDLIRVW